jgi:plasmid stability protein
MGISATDRRCTAQNKQGNRCSARAVERGLCAAHAGLVDMKAIGKKGGSRSPLTKLRRAAAEHDDSLREQARQVLSRALAGEQVDKQQLDAARSLFSYRADSPPPSEHQDVASSKPQLANGRPVTNLADVIRFGLEIDQLSPSVVEACREVVAAAATPPEVEDQTARRQE